MVILSRFIAGWNADGWNHDMVSKYAKAELRFHLTQGVNLVGEGTLSSRLVYPKHPMVIYITSHYMFLTNNTSEVNVINEPKRAIINTALDNFAIRNVRSQLFRLMDRW